MSGGVDPWSRFQEIRPGTADSVINGGQPSNGGAPSSDPWAKFTPVRATFGERFQGEGPGVMVRDEQVPQWPGGPSLEDILRGQSIDNDPEAAQALRQGMQTRADELLVGPADAGNQAAAFVLNSGNTAGLNLPRNIGAGIATAAGALGVPGYSERSFEENYQLAKDKEAALSRQFPKTATAGTVTGVVGGAVALPGLAGAPTWGGRALQAGATAGGYSAVSEFADSKDPLQAAKAGGIGFAAGTVAQPFLEGVGRVLGPMIQRGISYRNPDGSITREAAQALQDAGLDPRQIPQALDEQLTGLFASKGVSTPIAREAAAAEFAIPLSRGQTTDDAATRLFEGQALSGGRGDKAQEIATQFTNRQQQAVTGARDEMAERFGRGQVSLDNPVEAGGMVGDAVRGAAARGRADFKGRYQDAFSRPGEFAAEAFQGISGRINRGLSEAAEPVIIDDVTTPIASRALQDINNISNLRIQNRAAPAGAPTDGASEIVGVNLRGVDQARRRLVSFYKAAKGGQNANDLRAVGRVIDEFDEQVERAVADGLFSGDEGVLDALKGARSAYSSYQKTFRPQGAGDDVGSAMRRIVERDATPEEIARYLIGSSRVGASGTSVRLADRIGKVLGEDSAEWAAIRQAAWMKLSGAGESRTPLTPKQMAERIVEFTTGEGSTLAKRLFSAEELANMRRFANATRATIPQRGHETANRPSMPKVVAQNAIDFLAGSLGFYMSGPMGATAALGSRIGRKFTGEVSSQMKATKNFGDGAPRVPKPNLVRGVSPIAKGAGYAAGDDNDLRQPPEGLGSTLMGLGNGIRGLVR